MGDEAIRGPRIRSGMTSHAKLIVILVGTLCAATFGLFNWDARYRTVASEVAPNLSWGGGLNDWRVSPDGVSLTDDDAAIVALTVGAGQRSPSITLVLPDAQRFSHIRVAVDLKARNIVIGSKDWQQGRVILLNVGARGVLFRGWPNKIVLVSGTFDWQRQSAVIPVHPKAASLLLIVSQEGASGKLWARRIFVQGVNEAPWFKPVRIVLMVLWAAAGIWIVAAFLRNQRFRLPVLAVAGLSVLIIAAALAPQPQFADAVHRGLSVFGELLAATAPNLKASISGEVHPCDEGQRSMAGKSCVSGEAVLETRPWEPDDAWFAVELNPEINGVDLQAAAHVAVFAVLGFMVFMTFRDIPRHHLMLYLALAGISVEALQAFTLMRTPKLADSALDGLGIAFGFLAYQILRSATGRSPHSVKRSTN